MVHLLHIPYYYTDNTIQRKFSWCHVFMNQAHNNLRYCVHDSEYKSKIAFFLLFLSFLFQVSLYSFKTTRNKLSCLYNYSLGLIRNDKLESFMKTLLDVKVVLAP